MKPSLESHSFNIELACELGIEKAIILFNIIHWMNRNIINKKNVHDGLCWTYNSSRAFHLQFPYIPRDSIKRYLLELENDGWILSRNDLNHSKFDKTKWYSWGEKLAPFISDQRNFLEDTEAIPSMSQNDPSVSHPDPSVGHDDPTIPDINTDTLSLNLSHEKAEILKKNIQALNLTEKTESALITNLKRIALKNNRSLNFSDEELQELQGYEEKSLEMCMETAASKSKNATTIYWNFFKAIVKSHGVIKNNPANVLFDESKVSRKVFTI